MRAIKREKMDVKVLDRLKNMLTASEVEAKLDAEESKQKEKAKKQKKDEYAAANPVEMTEVPATPAAGMIYWYHNCQSVNSLISPTNLLETQEASMEVEGETPAAEEPPKKTRRPNLATMKNEKNQYPVWMSTKKIRHHKKLQKKIAKRTSKSAKMAKHWKTACSV